MTQNAEAAPFREPPTRELPQALDSSLATLPYEIVLPRPAPFDLKAWRTKRLGLMKQRPEYLGLPKECRALVDYMVCRHESPDEGITVSQGGERKPEERKSKTPTLAEAFGVSRRTIIKRLEVIVKAGVLTRERRARRMGTQGGRTTNRYRLSMVLTEIPVLSAEETGLHSTVPSTVHSGSSYEQVEVLPQGEQIEAPAEHAKDQGVTSFGESATSTTKTIASLNTYDHERSEARERSRERYREENGHYKGETPPW